MLERRPDVVEVRLFGSLARDQAHPGSDADLFATLEDDAGSFLERLPSVAREFSGAGIGCAVIAFTESEERALKARGGLLARAVFDEGLVLASRRQPEAR